MKDSRIVVVGANGQLGRAFQNLLPGANFLGHRDLDLTWPKGRQGDQLRQLNPLLVFNCAAYNDVDGAESDATADQVNGFGVRRLADACREISAELVTYSTDYVFDGEPVVGGYTEGHTPHPLSAYARSKREGEVLVAGMSHATVIRTSWVFGDGQNFVRLMLSLADQGREEVTVTSDLISRPTHAPDLAEATMNLLDLGESRPHLIHIANEGEPISKAGQAEAVFEIAGRNVSVKQVTTEEYYAGKTGYANRPHYSVFSLGLMQSCGISMPTWRDALVTYLGA